MSVDILPTEIYGLNKEIIWIFTDGGAIGNGKKHCKASWAYLIIGDFGKYSQSGLVDPVDIPDKVYKSSNNRGELTAILKALEVILDKARSPIKIISDSKYGIGCLDVWINTWLKNPDTLPNRLNIDLIMPSKILVDKIRETISLTFDHVKSHKTIPNNPQDKFIWEGNDTVDKLCTKCLTK